MGFNLTTILLITFTVLTCMTIILWLIRFSKFHNDLTRISKDLSDNFNNCENILKKINSADLEMLSEQRRASKLMAQLLEQFDGAEIIDEFIRTTDEQDDEMNGEE